MLEYRFFLLKHTFLGIQSFQIVTYFYIVAEHGEKYLAGIIVLMILLIISFLIIACLIYQIRRLKSSKENSENNRKEKNYSKGIYENPDKLKDDGNYEEMEDIQLSTYTALKRPEDENEHLYTHLQMNQVQHD